MVQRGFNVIDEYWYVWIDLFEGFGIDYGGVVGLEIGSIVWCVGICRLVVVGSCVVVNYIVYVVGGDVKE